MVNGKVYVGSAVNLKRRRQNHFDDLRRGDHGNPHLQNHVNKYGSEDLWFGIIEFCSEERLIEREQYWIDALKPDFNICLIAGSSLGVKRSPECCIKNRERTSKRWADQSYRERQIKAHKGQMHTEEQKKRMSEIMKKVVADRGGHWNTGFHHSEESIQKIATFQRGRKKSDEMKRKFSESRKGHVVSAETRRKISKTKKQRQVE
jgi:group I intron endonuclease